MLATVAHCFKSNTLFFRSRSFASPRDCAGFALIASRAVSAIRFPDVRFSMPGVPWSRGTASGCMTTSLDSPGAASSVSVVPGCLESP